MNASATRFLVVFDVDSTLIQDEVIELLADVAGKRSEVAEVTERAMSGELDFASSLAERVATLVGLPERVIAETVARVRPTPGLSDIIDAVHSRGGKVAAVSGGFSQILEPLAADWGLDFWRANLLEIEGGVLTGRVSGEIVDRRVKAEMLETWASTCNLSLAQTLAVGDGANDLDMLALAGLGVAFNAKPVVRASTPLSVERNLGELICLLP